MVSDLQAAILRQCQQAIEQEPFKGKWEIPVECEPALDFAPRRSVSWDAALRAGIALEDTGSYWFELVQGKPKIVITEHNSRFSE